LAKRIYIRLTKDISRALIALSMGIHHPIESAKKPGSSGALNRAFKAGRLPLI